MPVDPKKLKAFASKGKAAAEEDEELESDEELDEEDEDLEEGEEGLPEEDEEEEEEEPAEEDPAGTEEEEAAETLEDEEAEGNFPTGPTNPGAVIPFLEQYADEIEACCDELDYDVLLDPNLDMSEEDEVIMSEGALMLPPRLQANLWHLTDIDLEAALAIGKHLEEEKKSQDAARTGGWVYRIGQLLASEGEDEAGDIPIEDEEAQDPEMEDEVAAED